MSSLSPSAAIALLIFAGLLLKVHFHLFLAHVLLLTPPPPPYILIMLWRLFLCTLKLNFFFPVHNELWVLGFKVFTISALLHTPLTHSSDGHCRIAGSWLTGAGPSGCDMAAKDANFGVRSQFGSSSFLSQRDCATKLIVLAVSQCIGLHKSWIKFYQAAAWPWWPGGNMKC